MPHDSELTVIIGPRGSGKTALMTKLAYDDYTNNGRHTIANYQLGWPFTYMTYAEIIELPDDLKDANVLLDEIFVGAGSRKSFTKSNIKMTEFVTQIRKRKCDVFYTVQKARLIDVNLRDQTDTIVETKKSLEGIFEVVVRDRHNWHNKNSIIHKFIFDARNFFKLNLYDTDEVVKFGEEVEELNEEETDNG